MPYIIAAEFGAKGGSPGFRRWYWCENAKIAVEKVATLRAQNDRPDILTVAKVVDNEMVQLYKKDNFDVSDMERLKE